MVAITNLGSRHHYPAGSQVESIRDIARKQQISLDESVDKKLRRKQRPISAEHPPGAVFPGTIAHTEHALADKGFLSAAKTTARTPMGRGADAHSLKPAAFNTRQVLAPMLLSPATLLVPPSPLPAGESQILSDLDQDPFAAFAGENKHGAQRGEGMRAMATPMPAALEDGNTSPASDGGSAAHGTEIEGTSGTAADARILTELASGVAPGMAAQADYQANEARAGQQAFNRQANPGHEAPPAQQQPGANTGRTLTYAFNSVPGNHRVQVAAGQSVTLLPSSQEVLRQMTNHHMPEGYRLLPAGDEQRGQQPNQDPPQEDEE
ncbi:hypothetical protein [Acerihabitans sp.]|uniref:SpaN/EivJ family type III secretion system needle length determinant n=1 Tax=Acerihabitans sp. TaxID=2811394 RepID=UPI002EDB5872